MKRIRPDGFYHREAGKYLKDAVYGANDGIITTFAIVAGVAGADLAVPIVLLLGSASLLADGFSMAASSLLAARSERDVYQRERSVEEWELRNRRVSELTEMQALFKERGYSPQDAKNLTDLLVKNKDLWLDTIMREELKLSGAHTLEPIWGALTTFFAFVIAGIIPLFSYFFLPPNHPHLFFAASLLTVIALFAAGAIRSRFIKRSAFFAGIEMMAVGGIAAVIAYTIGAFVKTLIG